MREGFTPVGRAARCRARNTELSIALLILLNKVVPGAVARLAWQCFHRRRALAARPLVTSTFTGISEAGPSVVSTACSRPVAARQAFLFPTHSSRHRGRREQPPGLPRHAPPARAPAGTPRRASHPSRRHADRGRTVAAQAEVIPPGGPDSSPISSWPRLPASQPWDRRQLATLIWWWWGNVGRAMAVVMARQERSSAQPINRQHVKAAWAMGLSKPHEQTHGHWTPRPGQLQDGARA